MNILNLKIPAQGEDFVREYVMVSGVAEQQKHKYHMVRGKKDVWCYAANVPNPADHIYVNGGPGSQGFGGRKMMFELTDDRSVQFEGPWHSNDGALKNDTGVDLSDKHATWCCIGESSKGYGGDCVIENILWRDDAVHIGTFARKEVEELAQRIADETGKTVYMHKETAGGSSTCGFAPRAKSIGERDKDALMRAAADWLQAANEVHGAGLLDEVAVIRCLETYLGKKLENAYIEGQCVEHNVVHVHHASKWYQIDPKTGEVEEFDE